MSDMLISVTIETTDDSLMSEKSRVYLSGLIIFQDINATLWKL